MKGKNQVCLLLAGLAPVTIFARPTPALAQPPFTDIPTSHPAAAAVAEMARQGFMNGYPDGTYGGNRAMTRYEVALAVMRMMQAPLRRDPSNRFWPIRPIPGPPLKDVPAAHWAADAVASLRQWGILAGYPDGTFSGNRVMTRGEFAPVLKRLGGFIGRLVDLEIEQRRKRAAPVPSPPAPGAAPAPAGEHRR